MQRSVFIRYITTNIPCRTKHIYTYFFNLPSHPSSNDRAYTPFVAKHKRKKYGLIPETSTYTFTTTSNTSVFYFLIFLLPHNNGDKLFTIECIQINHSCNTMPPFVSLYTFIIIYLFSLTLPPTRSI